MIENKPGTASAVGSLLVARSPADGYTLLLGTGTLAINKSLRKDLGYDVETDLMPVANAAGGPFLLLVHPDFPANTAGELIAYAKANPGKLNFGSPRHWHAEPPRGRTVRHDGRNQDGACAL